MTTRTLSVLLAVGLAACSSTATAPPAAAVTEHDLAADPTVSILPGQIGVTFLEPSDAASGLPDTGLPGVDEMTFELSEATVYTLGLDPDDASGTIARVELRAPTGAVLLTLTPATPDGTVALAAGRWVVAVHSGYAAAEAEGADHRTVFLRPPEVTVAASSRALVPGSGQPAAIGTDVTRLLTTRTCQGCDLSGANLARANLRAVRIARSNLSRSDLSGATLASADAFKADFTQAKLPSANLTLTNLMQANLCGADVTGATLEKVLLDGATWADCRVCRSGSIGGCR